MIRKTTLPMKWNKIHEYRTTSLPETKKKKNTGLILQTLLNSPTSNIIENNCQ